MAMNWVLSPISPMTMSPNEAVKAATLNSDKGNHPESSLLPYLFCTGRLWVTTGA